jgi:hypothetical protein
MNLEQVGVPETGAPAKSPTRRCRRGAAASFGLRLGEGDGANVKSGWTRGTGPTVNSRNLEEERIRRGERRRGRLTTDLDKRYDSRSKASKLSQPIVAADLGR